MLEFIFWTMNAGTVAVVYWWWIRPILKKTPALADLFKSEDTYLSAFNTKFGGIKQKLTAAAVYLSGSVVVMYDYIAPKLTGVDVTPITSHLAKVPPNAWPLIAIAITALMDYFRSLADKRTPPTGG